MPTVTHDGRSFMLDGRRVWLVSGSLPYARICRESWRERIHAARSAGLNAIDTPIFWNRHEPRPGKFDFKGENDLRHFLDLVKQAGLYAILRIGPYNGDAWDMGGLPPWLLENSALKLRAKSNPFLEACSRYISAVAEQVRGMQVTTPGGGGPILLIQVESNWTCGDDALADGYLAELDRYVREAGLSVPIVNSNSLWQSVEGQIDGWTGSEDMLASMRQLATVKGNQPRLVIAMRAGAERIWGRPEPEVLSPAGVQRRLAEVLAGGGQFNIHPFAGGTSGGFWPGRSGDDPDAFFTPANDLGAMLLASGAPSASYHPVRRIAHLASRFGRVFANLDPVYQPVAIDPAEVGHDTHAAGAKKGKPAALGLSVVHATGSQGSIAFVFDLDADRASEPRPGQRTIQLLLPDGSSMPLTLGKQSVAWCLFATHIGGRATLDYCNLNAFASLGQVFVAFGPAGSRAVLSVNGSPVDVHVPSGKTPLIINHEGLTVVIVSEDEIDNLHVTDQAIYVGVAGTTWDGAAIPLPGEKHYTKIDSTGKLTKITSEPAKVAAPDKVTASAWSMAPCDDYQAGTSPRFASIQGPADLTTLGCPFGYGWYRLTLKNASPRKASVLFPHAADRLQLFLDSEPVGVVGVGPGSHEDATLTLKKGTQQLVVLAENLGRFSAGSHLTDRKGLFGHAWEYDDIRSVKSKLVRSTPIDVLGFESPLWETRRGDATLPERVTWSFPHRRKNPLIVRFDRFPGRAILLLNDEPVCVVDRAGPRCVFLDPERIGRGSAVVQLALFGDLATQLAMEDIEESVRFAEGTASLSAKAEFAFAKWEPPPPSHFSTAKGVGRHTGPAWWRCSFKVNATHTPLYFEATGLTKGQVYVNGHHVSRYFVADGSGKPVPPQSRYHIPDAWLHHGRDNDLTLFDEHGASPTKARLVYDTDQRVIRA